MAKSDARLNVVFGAQMKDLQKALNSVNKKMSQFEQRNRRAARRSAGAWGAFKKQVAGILSATAIVSGIKGLQRWVSELVNSLDKLAKTADGLGLTIEQFTALSGIAVEAGVAQDKFAKGLAKLNKVIIDAGDGLTTYTRAFDRLGINIRDQNGDLKTSEAILFELKGALDKYGASQSTIASMMDIFGARIGPGMVRVLQDMEGSMAGVVERGRELGVVIEEKFVRSAEETRNQLDVMGQQVKGAGARIFEPMIDWAGELAEAFGKVAVNVADAAEAFRSLEKMSKRGLQAELDYLSKRDTGSSVVIDGRSMKVADRMDDIRRQLGLRGAVEHAMQGRAKTQHGVMPEVVPGHDLEAAEKAAKPYQDWAQMQVEGLRAREELLNKQELDDLVREEAAKEEAAAAEMRRMEERAAATSHALAAESEAVKEFSLALDANLSHTFQNIIDGTMSVEDAFKSMLASIISQIIQQQVTQPAASAIGSFLSAGLGSLFGGAGAAVAGPSAAGGPMGGLGGPIAPSTAGGGMAKAGRAYTVGEHGRELFIPQVGGRIVPHLATEGAAAAAGGGGQQVTIRQVNHFEAGMTRAEFARIVPQLEDATARGVMDRRRRGGAMRSTFGGR